MPCENLKCKCSNCLNDKCRCDGTIVYRCEPEETSCCCNK